MTGLDLGNDALIEVAALVTDFELNVLGDGVDVVIKPPRRRAGADGRLRPRHAHESGLLAELDDGLTWRRPSSGCSTTSDQFVPEPRKAPLAGNTVGTDRAFLARDMPTLERHLHYRMSTSPSIKELARRWFPRVYFAGPGQARQPPRARRHPGEHRGAALLPGGGLRAAARARQRDRPDRGHRRRTAARSPARPPTRPTSLTQFDAVDPAGTLLPRAAAGTRRAHGGCSSAGRAPGCGPGGRGFKSRHSGGAVASSGSLRRGGRPALPLLLSDLVAARLAIIDELGLRLELRFAAGRAPTPRSARAGLLRRAPGGTRHARLVP